jgi:endogenous inhibitor of DNA gyrase (YacG/DUF329 family)
MVSTRHQLPLKCPTCGKTGLARINSSHEGKSAHATNGFSVSQSADKSPKVTCSNCDTTVHLLYEPTGAAAVGPTEVRKTIPPPRTWSGLKFASRVERIDWAAREPRRGKINWCSPLSCSSGMGTTHTILWSLTVLFPDGRGCMMPIGRPNRSWRRVG